MMTRRCGYLAVILLAFLVGGSLPAWSQERNVLLEQGRGIYQENCAGCHRQNGEGLPNVFPALKGNAFVTGDEVALIRLLLNGRQGKMGRMPAWKNRLTDQQLAAVATFIRNHWGNQAPPVAPEAVAKERR